MPTVDNSSGHSSHRFSQGQVRLGSDFVNFAYWRSDNPQILMRLPWGDVLMDAVLYELTYMPSTVPGYAGMIQGGLDIPPVFAGGINNTLNSTFLDAMVTASAVGEPTMFWFFADEALFDNEGGSLIPLTGITGAFEFAVGVPEPSSIILFTIAMLAAARVHWRCKYTQVAGHRRGGNDTARQAPS